IAARLQKGLAIRMIAARLQKGLAIRPLPAKAGCCLRRQDDRGTTAEGPRDQDDRGTTALIHPLSLLASRQRVGIFQHLKRPFHYGVFLVPYRVKAFVLEKVFGNTGFDEALELRLAAGELPEVGVSAAAAGIRHELIKKLIAYLELPAEGR